MIGADVCMRLDVTLSSSDVAEDRRGKLVWVETTPKMLVAVSDTLSSKLEGVLVRISRFVVELPKRSDETISLTEPVS